jgi:hypothetical protein
MVKTNKNKKNKKKNNPRGNSNKQNGTTRNKIANFGPVSSINTAPVAIGNSVRGAKAQVIESVDGCRVIGRDFAFSLTATAAAVTGWTLIGGMPLTPAVLPSSILRNYTQMYSKFKVNRINVHYITASPTSQAGDVMFYYERDRRGPMIDFTNNSFLPYVLSDPHTVIGPQWTNHTLTITPSDGFNLTDYGVHTDLNEDSCGSIFMFSRTSSASSPGYVIIDYDITFKELCVNPRAGILPIARGQWYNTSIGVGALAVTSGTTAFNMGIAGDALGDTVAVDISGVATGDIYKVVFDVTNSTVVNAAWTNVTTSTLLVYQGPSGSTAVTIDDGFTCYAVRGGSSFYFYPTLEAAYTSTNQFRYGVTATVTFVLTGWFSLVGFSSNSVQSSY